MLLTTLLILNSPANVASPQRPARLCPPLPAFANRAAITAAIAAEIDRALDSVKNLLDRLIFQLEAAHPAITAARKRVNAGNNRSAPAIVPPAA